MNVLLQPFARDRHHESDNFSQTIEKRFDLRAAVRERKDSTRVDLGEFLQAHPDGTAHLWSPGPSRFGISSWEKLRPGDLVLFLGNNAMYAYGLVTSRIHWSDNSAIWADGTGWDRIYSLDRVVILPPEDRIGYGRLQEAIPKFNHRPVFLKELSFIPSGSVLEELMDELEASSSLSDLETTAKKVDFNGRVDVIHPSHSLQVEVSPERVPTLDGRGEGVTAPLKARGKAGARLDKLAEQKAVSLVTQYLTDDKWTLKKDLQKSGVGYDLHFVKGDRELHLEVKGIQSGSLLFNLTAKEWLRVLEDENFLVAAVTNVLDDRKFYIHFIYPDQLAQADRAVLSYRLRVRE